MYIQRQVIGKQVQIVAQQRLQALALDPTDALFFTAPEVAMVHQHRVGLFHQGRIQQGLTGGDPADHPANLLAPLHLKAIRAVILETCALQLGIQRRQHDIPFDHLSSWLGRPWRSIQIAA